MGERSIRIAALAVMLMTIIPSVMPWGAVMGSSVTTFSDNSITKDAVMPTGGGTYDNAYVKLPSGVHVRDMRLNLTPKGTDYNVSVALPAQEGFSAGTYDPAWLDVDQSGIRAKNISFGYYDKFLTYDGIDNASTTANVQIDEGLSGVALWPDNSTNVTMVSESAHGVDAIATLSWGGRLIKNLTLNASGTTQWGSLWATVKLWNNQTSAWETKVNNVDIGTPAANYTLVDQDYLNPKYSMLYVSITPTWAAGTRNMWFRYNVTVQGFDDASVVTSNTIDPSVSYGWDPSWNIYGCSVDTERTVPVGTNITIALSATDGASWQNVTGQSLVFDTPGPKLRWKAYLNSTDVNKTPLLKAVTLVCSRKMPSEPLAYLSREYRIDEGSFVSYSIDWTGTIPPGTSVVASAGRTSGELATIATVNQKVDLEYNSSLRSIQFRLGLLPDDLDTPIISTFKLTYTVSVSPSDVFIDVGDDGTIDWNMTGPMGGPVLIKDAAAAGMIAGLNANVPKAGPAANIKLKIGSRSSGAITMSDLFIEFGLPPVLRAAVPQVNMSEDADLSKAIFLDAYFTDDYDAGALAYSIVRMDDPGKVLAQINGSWVDLKVPTKDWSGISTIRVRATDKDGTWNETNNITVKVAPVNDLPVITYVPTGVPAWVGVTFFAPIEAADADGDALRFWLDVQPAGASIDADTGMLEWRPAHEGASDFTVNVSDATGFTLKSFVLNAVLDMTKVSAPMFTTKAITEARAGTPYRYEAAAQDLDGDRLEFSLLTAPVGMAVNSTTGAVSWEPTAKELGYHDVVLKVSDGSFFAQQRYRLLVLNSALNNKQPVISSSPPTEAWVGKPYIYAVKAADPDAGTVLFYSLGAGPKTMSLDAGGLIVWVPTANDVGQVAVQVIVTDGVIQVPQAWTLNILMPERTCIISTPSDYQVVKDKVVVTGLASGPSNLTRIEVRVGKDEWKTASGTTQWSIELNLKGKPAGYYYIKARACDSVTCSKEASVRIYHEGQAGTGFEFNIYWWFAIAVIVVVVVVLIVDWKVKFIRGPADMKGKAQMDDEDQDMPDQRGMYKRRGR